VRFSLSCGFLLLCSSLSLHAEDGLPAECRDAWSARAKAFQTFRITWDEESFAGNGAVRSVLTDDGQVVETDDPSVPVAARSTRYVQLWDGDRVRLEQTRRDVQSGEGEPRMEGVAVNGGGIIKGLGRYRGQSHHQGSIGGSEPIPSPSILSYRPILVLFRATDPRYMTVDPDGVKLTRRTVRDDDGEYLVAELRTDAEPGKITTLWIDADRDYFIRRYEVIRSGVMTVSLDITSAYDDTVGRCLPSEWLLQTYGRDAALRQTAIGKVISCDAAPDVSNADFNLEFPAGTRYQDNRLSGIRIFEVQPDGSSREIPLPGRRLPRLED
jgi:hypothetical protein